MYAGAVGRLVGNSVLGVLVSTSVVGDVRIPAVGKVVGAEDLLLAIELVDVVIMVLVVLSAGVELVLASVSVVFGAAGDITCGVVPFVAAAVEYCVTVALVKSILVVVGRVVV